MLDLAWLSREARTIHEIFAQVFYGLATIMVLLGVIVEYFKIPLGASGFVGPLIGRVFVATLLLHSYPEITNALSDFTDALCGRIGNLNDLHVVLSKMGDKLSELSFSWTSIKETVTMIISFVTFFLLYISIYLANAGVVYVWLLLYVFSPLLIVMYILPVTSGATKALFRSLFEVCAWKIVWATLAALLWSLALSDINKQGSNINFLTVIALNLILAISLLLTPLVVNALTSKGLGAMTGSMLGMAAGASVLSPGGIATSTVRKGINKAAEVGLPRANASKQRNFSEGGGTSSNQKRPAQTGFKARSFIRAHREQKGSQEPNKPK